VIYGGRLKWEKFQHMVVSCHALPSCSDDDDRLGAFVKADGDW
jgi:hypothetical protein